MPSYSDAPGKRARRRAASAETPRVEVSALSEHITVVTLRGEHGLASKGRLLEALAGVGDVPNLIIDLTPCAFVDSSIIGVLLQACASTLTTGRQAEIVLPDNQADVDRALTRFGVRGILVFHLTLGHALQSAGENHASALTAAQHVVRIKDRRASFGDPEIYAAECSCGWYDEEREGMSGRRTAKVQARQHIELERSALR